jgi:hypothetical protein
MLPPVFDLRTRQCRDLHGTVDDQITGLFMRWPGRRRIQSTLMSLEVARISRTDGSRKGRLSEVIPTCSRSIWVSEPNPAAQVRHGIHTLVVVR